MRYGQLVCYGCHHILTYPLGIYTCRCRICKTVNAVQHMEVTCGACGQLLHAPINTLTLLCPCCATITDIPESLLPPLPSCVKLGDGTEEMEEAIYVSHPTLSPTPQQQQQQQETTNASNSSNKAAASNSGNPTSPSSSSLAQKNEKELTREKQEGAQRADDGSNVYHEVNDNAPAAAARQPAVPMHLAPTVMIATRIL
jgi:LSD1 subclass zinc finger protein